MDKLSHCYPIVIPLIRNMCVAEWEGGRTRAVASKYMGGKLILNGGQIAKQRPFPFMKTLITALHAEICTKCGADVAS